MRTRKLFAVAVTGLIKYFPIQKIQMEKLWPVVFTLLGTIENFQLQTEFSCIIKQCEQIVKLFTHYKS